MTWLPDDFQGMGSVGEITSHGDKRVRVAVSTDRSARGQRRADQCI